MKSRKWIAWVLAGIMMLPGAGMGEKNKNAVKTKQILRTWLCAGEEALVRESPKENAAVLWTLETDRMYQTDRHVDQYYQLTNEDGRTGYVSKGAVRICNAKDMTAGIMFKLPHVNPKTPRQPVEPVLAPAITAEEADLFVPAEESEQTLEVGERVYVFSTYGHYAAVWHRGRLGYILKEKLTLLQTDALAAYTAKLPTDTGSIQAHPILTEAFRMLEAGNPIALRYSRMTGTGTEPLFSAGVPYFWGGQDDKILLERWPEYTTRKQWQGTHDFYQKDSIYVYGLDCVGYVTTTMKNAGTPLEETLNDLGDKKHCQAGTHLFCSAANPFPEDWREVAQNLAPGDVLALHHPGRHVMICIGTLRDYGYTEEQLPALAGYLDHPLMIHSGENPMAYQRFDCLTARSGDKKVSKALGSDGGVSLCLLGVPRDAAETEVQCHERTYFCFDVEGACVTIFNFSNVRDYYVYRSDNTDQR